MIYYFKYIFFFPFVFSFLFYLFFIYILLFFFWEPDSFGFKDPTFTHHLCQIIMRKSYLHVEIEKNNDWIPPNELILFGNFIWKSTKNDVRCESFSIYQCSYSNSALSINLIAIMRLRRCYDDDQMWWRF